MGFECHFYLPVTDEYRKPYQIRGDWQFLHIRGAGGVAYWMQHSGLITGDIPGIRQAAYVAQGDAPWPLLCGYTDLQLQSRK